MLDLNITDEWLFPFVTSQACRSNMISSLKTNEVKQRAGTEVEFDWSRSDGRSVTLSAVVAAPSQPHTLKISHEETGSGTSRRRRSVCRFDKTIPGQVDIAATMKGSGYIVLDLPVGQMLDATLAQDLVAQLLSFVGTTGAATVVLFDGTGTGAIPLINGTT